MPGSPQIADSITEDRVHELTTPVGFPALESGMNSNVLATNVMWARMGCLQLRCRAATVAEGVAGVAARGARYGLVGR